MANRIIGGITPWSTNFEAEIAAPFDARLTTPEYPQLADSSIPYPYPGMLVAVTNDEDRAGGGDIANNGIYLFTASASKSAADSQADWTKISTDGGVTITSVSSEDGLQTITMSDSTVYQTQIDTLRLFEFDSNGGFYFVNEDLSYEGNSTYNNNPTLYVQRGASYKIKNLSTGHPLIITKTQSVIDNPAGLSSNVLPLNTDDFVYWNIPQDAPDEYYYYCQLHGSMNGVIKVEGADGAKGEPGAKGEEGSEGAKGDTGLKGADGAKGDVGPQGEGGPQGQKGEDGTTGAKGDLGPQGQKGDQGDLGPEGPQGGQGDKGDVGPQGQKGDQGDLGPEGPQGEAGPTGGLGPQGGTGDQGAKGDTGAKGETGTQGQKGEEGTAGGPGQKGEEGTAGGPGQKGEDGTQGAKGAEGIEGPQGPAGATGPQGGTGGQGAKGDTGAKGETGADVDYSTSFNGPHSLGADRNPGNQTLGSVTVDTGLSYIGGEYIIVSLDAGPDNFDIAQVTSYDSSTGVIMWNNVSQSTNASFSSNWNINLTGIPGQKGEVGAQGPQGVEGPVGSPGAQGSVGPTGGTGTTGAKGDNGPQGQKGEEGVAGGPGQKGEDGSEGPQGSPGAQGSVGPTGGTGSPGAKGAQGEKGADSQVAGQKGDTGGVGPGITFQGDVATQGDLPGSGNTQGDAYIVQEDDSFWVWNGSAWVDGGSIQGDKGQKGEDGNSITGDKGDKGDTGLIQVDTTCTGAELTGQTDVYAFLDSTSGPYSAGQGDPNNRPSVYEALSQWHADYTNDNPGYTGNLYICIPNGGSTKEQWLQHLVAIRESNSGIRASHIPDANEANNAGLGWVYTGSSTVGSNTYNYTTAGMPADWGGANYVVPTRAFVINLTNETQTAYHDVGSNLSGQPKAAWNSDRTDFVAAHAGMDYFGGILYPLAGNGNGANITGATAAMLLHGYAAITGQNPVVEADFQTALGVNFAGGGYTNFFAGAATNPYATGNADISAYNYSGIFTKQSGGQTPTQGGTGLTLNFTAAEFAADINSILQGSDTTSQINVVQSYTNNILTVAGFTSQTIDYSLTPEGCISMEVDEASLTGQSGAKGDVGATGPQGPAGGVGPQGGTGAPGAKGDVGPQGPSGIGSQGQKGEVGPQGQKGQTGPASLVAGPQGPAGATGPQGGTGSPGAKGAQGDKGDQGPSGIGSQGAKGATGGPGPQGSAGPTGGTGGQGAKGDQGPKGDVGPQGQKGQTGAASLVAGPSGPTGPTGGSGEPGAKGDVGPQGPSGIGSPGAKGDAGFDFEYEHIALNPIARDEVFTSAGVSKAFVKVPDTLGTQYYLHKIQSSFGSNTASSVCYFKLVEFGSNGTPVDVAGASWQHAANTYFDEHTISGTSLTGLSGKSVYIVFTDGSTDANGYTATLIWKRA